MTRPDRCNVLWSAFAVALLFTASVVGQSSCILYSDSFEGATLSPDWSVATSGTGSGSVSGGNFVLAAPGVVGAFTTARLTASGANAWTDYTIDFDFFVPPSSCQGAPSADLLVRNDQAAGTGYVIAFHDSLINLWREGAILEQQVSALIPLSTWHHAQVVVAGAAITVSVDGVSYLSTTLAAFSSHTHGTVGFDAAWCSTNLFDNVLITTTCPPPPTITGLTVDFSSLIGGMPIGIHGSGFLSSPTTVTIGGVPVSGMNIVDASTIECFTPALPTEQLADVVVSTLGGAATLPAAVSYRRASLGIAGTPQIGSSFGLWVASHANSPIILLADTAPGNTQLGPFGYSGLACSASLTPVLDYFGVFTGSSDPTAVTNATGLWHNVVQVPNVPALAGTSVWGQVFVFSFFPLPPNGLFFIGNTLQLTFVP